MDNQQRTKYCIFMGGIPITASHSIVADYFGQFGLVVKVKLNKSRVTQKLDMEVIASHRGCGFVEMLDQTGLKAALSVRDHRICGQIIDCRLAMTNKERKSYHLTLNNERRKVFIGKIPKSVTKEVIESFFSSFVDIEETTLIQKDGKDFAICFLLLKGKGSGDILAGKTFDIGPGVSVECQLALFPQQLHQKKIVESSHYLSDELTSTINHELNNTNPHSSPLNSYTDHYFNERCQSNAVCPQISGISTPSNDYKRIHFDNQQAHTLSHTKYVQSASCYLDRHHGGQGSQWQATLVHNSSYSTQGASLDLAEKSGEPSKRIGSLHACYRTYGQTQMSRYGYTIPLHPIVKQSRGLCTPCDRMKAHFHQNKSISEGARQRELGFISGTAATSHLRDSKPNSRHRASLYTVLKIKMLRNRTSRIYCPFSF